MNIPAFLRLLAVQNIDIQCTKAVFQLPHSCKSAAGVKPVSTGVKPVGAGVKPVSAGVKLVRTCY